MTAPNVFALDLPTSAGVVGLEEDGVATAGGCEKVKEAIVDCGPRVGPTSRVCDRTGGSQPCAPRLRLRPRPEAAVQRPRR
jgi:hypothetical protein